MTDTFRNFRCWRASVVQETILGDIGMIRLKADAVFLAAHAPVPVERRKGAVVRGHGETQILNALKDDLGIAERNTIMAITGGVGTGKSHVVRWVQAHLSQDLQRYRTIYVPRDVATLRELLSSVLEALPGDKASTARRHLNDAISQKSDSQLMTALINNLREVLAHELSDRGDGDPEMRMFLLGQRSDRMAKRRHGLADILLNLEFIEHLSRDDGTVAAVIRSLKNQRSGRDQDFPEFTAEDIPTRRRGIRNKLDPALLGVWDSMIMDSIPAVALLNEALRRAVPMTLGLEAGATLDDVFRETRQLLHAEGAELILIFEDLALFGLIEDALFNQFVLQPGGTYCPLRVLFAITDAKFLTAVPDTVRDRITHHYIIQNLENDRTGDATPVMTAFVARYLNNARVGRDGVVTARDNADDDARQTGAWIPNACAIRENGQPCRHRDQCFESFGSVNIGAAGNVGLYPYNGIALRRAFGRLRREGALSPRSLVDTVVRDFLVTADLELRDGAFPSEQAQSWFDIATDRAQEAIVPADTGLTEGERSRLLRARIIWADGDPENGGIHLAFDLPGKVAAHGAHTGPVALHTRSQRQTWVLRPTGTGPAQSLYDWESGISRLPDRQMEEFRRLFHRWVQDRLDLGRYLVHIKSGTGLAVLNAIFSQVSFVIANAPGAAPGPNRVRFDVPHSRMGLRLLLAARWFADHGHWDRSAEDRRWDFPRGLMPAELQVELEDWLGACAEKVEAHFLQTISGGSSRPAEAVVILRTAALRALGQLNQDDAERVIDAVATGGCRDGTWSSNWQVLAQPATDVLRSLRPELIAEFASARQGDTGDPLVVDAAQLEPAALAAMADPAAAIAGVAKFPQDLSEIEKSRALLDIDWGQAITKERQELLATVREIGDALGSEGPRAVQRSAEFGARANALSVFRPRDRYREFRDEIERLESEQDTVSDWIAAATVLDQLVDNPMAVFDAQSWATRARSYALSLRTVLEAVRETTSELERRTAQQAGEDPDKLAERAARQIEDAATWLERMSRGRST